ncbi:Bromodomain adjacent to zinc finger domain protein 2B [Trichinella papuae]|uniref:Bromodomain adjacent to zinc finger domain protein 2B n=1 Tax=Trichinella papuae TaxID=268474 RepID=A0A0V1N6S5_9BILA|nr:Bromodomain adjacent to zinc finger domain protein 2B [Trichinella papuae]
MDISRPSSSSSGLGRGGSLCSTNGCADNGRPNSVSSSASASSQSPFGATVEQLMGNRSVSAAAAAAASLSNASAFSSVGGGGSFASFNPFFFPFMPYAVGGASPISGFWPYAFPATTGDYFLQMATLFGRNQQSAGAGAGTATGSAAAASALEESFPEILHRLSKAASGTTAEQTTMMQACSSSSSSPPNAVATAAAAETSSPPVVDQAAASFWTKGESSSISSSSSTSAAGSLVQKSQTSGSGQPRGKQRQQSAAGDRRRADEPIDFPNPKRHSAADANAKPKSSPDEQAMIPSVVGTSNGGGSTIVGDEPTSTSGKRFAVSSLEQQNIFNVSAAAWAALSNQILLTNLQTGLFTGGLGAAANPVQQAEPAPVAVNVPSTDDRATSASTSLSSTMTSPLKRTTTTTTTTLEPAPATPTRARAAATTSGGGGARRTVSSRRGRTPTVSRRGAAGRGRPATISSNDTRPAPSASTLDPKETNRSSVDDTIDDVVSGQPRSPAAAVAVADNALSQFYYAFSSLDHFMNPNAYTTSSTSSAGRSGPGRPRRRAGRGSRGGITVRQQLAMMKRAGSGVGSTPAATAVGNKASPQAQLVGGTQSTNANVVDTTTTTTTQAGAGAAAALDLRTTKSKKATPTQQHADLSSSGTQRATNGHLDNNLMEKNLGETANRKRVVNPKLLRNPILCGWRRQTVIRHISASGIRGDVLYYAPCGKRLGSYVEVMRYLRKNGIINLTKEDFSFSSKIIVGEFVCNRRDSLKSGLVNLSEMDVLTLLSQLKNNGSGGSLPSMTNSPNEGGANDSLSRRSKRVTTALVRKSSVTKATTQRRKLEFKQSDGERGRVRNLKAQQKLKKQQNQQEAPAVKRVVEKAAAVMREEQKLLKSNEKEVKVRQIRVPVEDTEVEHAKPLPEFTPIKHLQLDSSAFADLLMVMQFVTTFGHVLNIRKSDIPSLATMHAGLLNNPPDQQAVVNLTKTLLSLLLEYSNLPTGASAVRTCTGVTLKDATVTDANYSELLRLFFTSREDTSCQQLANSLENNSFEAVDPSVKVRMLAYMCNDLLYCRNVVREVESNIEELAKLKSDKWSMKGKIRALRLARAAKVGEQQKKVVDKDQKSDESTASEQLEASSSAEKKYDQKNAEEANNNQQLHNCDEMTTKDDLKSEQQQQHGGGESGHSGGALFESELTPEEKQMSPEEIDKMIDTLSKVCCCFIKIYFFIYYFFQEVDQMRCKISNRGLKIRSLPLGQDRLRRNYWMINEIRGILVQSVESGSSTVETDVRDCVVALRDAVAALMDGGDDDDDDDDDHHHHQQQQQQQFTIAKNDATVPDDRQLKSAYAKASAPTAAGGDGGGDSCCWWIIDQPSKVDELLQSLSQRGIRERLFSRSLAKYSDTYKECAFGDKSAIELTPTIRRSGPSFVEQMMTVLAAIQQLEDKCYQANIHAPGWHPEEGEYNNNIIINSAESELSLLNTDDDDDDILTLVKARLLNLEKNIERRYLTPFINHNEAKMFQSNSSRTKLSSKGNDNSSEDLPAQIVHWRQGVNDARSAAQFHMYMDALESFVAWEKSIMKAMCQICRDDCNESQLLLCDGCDMGYHTYCFRPKMTKVPEEDWYCPECVAKATRRSCCLVCCRHSSQPMLACAECGREYHAECVDLDPEKNVKSNWRCFGCCKLRKSLANGPSTPKRRKLETKEKRRPVESSNKKSPNKKVVKNEKKKQQQQPEKKKATSNSGSPTTATSAVTYSGFDYEEICSIILAELDAHRDSWPFKKPVDSKLVPLYKKVIKKPMDLSAIHAKLISHKYQRGEDFVKDVNLVFDNCKTFNEDDSKIGKAGHSLRRFFTRRWKELHAATQLKRF